MPDEPDDFETFYRQNLRLVYAAALARRSDPDFAEDVAPETFLLAILRARCPLNTGEFD